MWNLGHDNIDTIEYRFAVKAIMLKYTGVSSLLNTEIFNELRFHIVLRWNNLYKMLSVTIWKVTKRSFLHTNKSFFKHKISVKIDHSVNQYQTYKVSRYTKFILLSILSCKNMQDLLLSLLWHSSLADGRQFCCWGKLSESQEYFVIASSSLL